MVSAYRVPRSAGRYRSRMAVELDLTDLLRRESARFHEVLADADPAARVPSCPDWTAADLGWHLAEVQLFWGAIVRDRMDDPGAADKQVPQRPQDYRALLELCSAASAGLLDALSAAADDERVWTWFDADQSVRFVRRRQVHEALIHRLDAELSTGTVTPIDAQVATDGVQEVLDWMYSGVPGWAIPGAGAGPVGRIATTDTGASWLVRLGSFSGTSPNSGNTYTDEPTLTLLDGGDPTFTVEGPAADLDVWLWNRPPTTPIALGGDYAAFEALIRSGVQ